VISRFARMPIATTELFRALDAAIFHVARPQDERGGIPRWWDNGTHLPRWPQFLRIAAKSESIAEENESPLDLEASFTR
jgi:hypothetical protein